MMKRVRRPEAPCISDPQRREVNSGNHVLILYGKRMCSYCPIKPECLALGLKEDREGGGRSGAFGLYGGLTARERQLLVSEKPETVRVCRRCEYDYVSRGRSGVCASCVPARDARALEWIDLDDLPKTQTREGASSRIDQYRDKLEAWRAENPPRSWGQIGKEIGVTRNAVAKWYKRHIEGRVEYGR